METKTDADDEFRRESASWSRSPSLEVRSIVLLAGALLRFGLPAHRVEEAASRLGHAFGRTTTVLGLPTALSLTVSTTHGIETHTVRAEPGAMDLARLDSLHAIVGRLERRELDAQGVLDAVDHVLQPMCTYPAPVRFVAGGLVACGAAPAFGGSGVDLLVAFVIGAFVNAFGAVAVARARHGGIVAIMSALGATIACAALARELHDLHPVVVALGSLVVVFPGFQLATATVELATGHWVSGTARAAAAFVTFLELGFGVLLGLRLGALAAIVPVPISPGPVALEVMGALFMTAGFGVLGNARPSDALGHVGISALAYGLCRGLRAPFGPELATLTAAFAAGLGSHALARRYDRPSSVWLVPSAWMLVPGSLGMVGMSAAIVRDTDSAVDAIVRMAMLVVALGTGFILGASVLSPRPSF